MKKVVLLVSGLLLAASVVGASTITFDFHSVEQADAASLSFTAGGVIATVSAWANTGTGGLFVEGTTHEYNTHGLGDCNATEGSNCSDPSHQVDNQGGTDFLDIHFSTPIDVLSFILMNTGDSNPGTSSNMDSTVYTRDNSAAYDLTTLTFATLVGPFSSPTNNSSGGAIPKDIIYPTAGALPPVAVNTTVTDLIIAAEPGDTVADFFKLYSLDFTTASVPEPATVGCVGAALVLLGGYRLRRRNRQTN